LLAEAGADKTVPAIGKSAGGGAGVGIIAVSVVALFANLFDAVAADAHAAVI
jgi:hypothetical protein